MLALEKTVFKTWRLLLDIKLELTEWAFFLTMDYASVFGIFTLSERVHFRVLVEKKYLCLRLQLFFICFRSVG